MIDIALIEFEYPYVLLATVLFLVCHFQCPMRIRSIYFANISIFSNAGKIGSFWLTLIKFIAIISLFIAMAGPYTSRNIDITPKQGFDIAMVLDASESMYQRGFDETNFREDRFTVVKNIVAKFVQTRINDNLGVVVFGDSAFIAAPLTYDKTILADIITRLRVGIAGRSTAIFNAIGQSENLLMKSKAKTKIIILLTDGVDNRSTIPLDTVMAIARKNDIKIYSIGIGNAGEFNPTLLKKIANETKGKFFRATTAFELQAIYNEINALEKSEIKSKSFQKKTYHYKLLLLISIVSLFMLMLFRSSRGLL